MNYLKVDAEYLKEKIETGGYPKYQIQKIGTVKAKSLKLNERVKIYYYNDIAEIETKYVDVLKKDQVLITKTINNKEYNSIMSAIKFHKTYRQQENNNELYIPIVAPIYAYEINENIEFHNMYNQEVKLCPGDFIVPFDASRKEFYSIFMYNFQDNYMLNT